MYQKEADAAQCKRCEGSTLLKKTFIYMNPGTATFLGTVSESYPKKDQTK